MSFKYLLAEEQLVSVASAQIPQDHQAAAVANQNLPWLLRMLLEGFNWPQRLPTSVLIWQAMEGEKKRKKENIC